MVPRVTTMAAMAYSLAAMQSDQRHSRPIHGRRMAALLGAVPIALGYGAGGEARQPLGLVVVGGLLFSQLVTLYLTPVFYVYMSAIQEKVKSWKGSKKVVQEAPVAG